jgi:WD40 repeat protein
VVGAVLVFAGHQGLAERTARFLAAVAHAASDAGRYDQASRLSIIAVRNTWRQPTTPDAAIELGRSAFLSTFEAALCCHTRAVVSAAFSPDGTRIVTASNDKTALLWDLSWLLDENARSWANRHNPAQHLQPLTQAVCADKLGGSELVSRDQSGLETGRESVRRLTSADTDTATFLRGHEGEDVCAWRPSLPDRVLTWLFRNLWK